MSSYGVGYLLGVLVGFGAMIWLGVFLVRRKSTALRVLGMGVMALALVSLLGQVARMWKGSDEQWQQEFWKGMSESCHQKCGAWETSAESCTGYCGCTMAQVRKGRSLSELRSWAEANMKDGVATEKLKLEMEAVDLHCSAPLADDLFVKSCVEGCEGDLACVGSCSCVLGKLRSGERNADTQWLIALLKAETVSPADQERIRKASAGCEGANAAPANAAPTAPAAAPAAPAAAP